MRRFPVPVLLLSLAAIATSPLEGRQSREWWPGATYDPAVPAPASALGYDIGDYWTEHGQMLDYMRALEGASERVKVFSVGRTNEKRELILVAISDPGNIRRIEEIRTTVARLRDARQTPEAQAREIAASTPAIAWMNFANDGNESAAFETGIQLAYHLAAGTDATTQRILRDVVTIIYPAHNPESHSRHVAWMKASAMGNPDPDAQEHRGDWRMDTNNNHYQIDLNRDAVFLSQVESRVVIRELHRWNPVVFVDHHGNPDRFFFPPWALPVNPQIDAASKEWVRTYGRNIAAAFDRNGWTYFTRQVYDLHYPGYYDSYPALNGATGMTFETDGGGSKGLAYRLPDDRVTTLFDGILHHFTGAVASLLTTVEHRETRLLDFYNFRASAMAEVAKEKVKGFVLVPGKDPARAADLVELLLKHDIEVFKTTAPLTTGSAHVLMSGEVSKRTFPAGAYVIPASQPQKRLLRTLLDPETPLEEVFLEGVREAKAYNDKAGESAPRKSYGFYDVNAWSLPLAYGVEAYWTEEAFAASGSALSPVTERPAAPVARPARARYGYLFRWNSGGATRMMSALWKEGYQLAVTTRPATIDGRELDPGMIVARVQTNPPSLHDRIVALAKANAIEVLAAASALVDAGRDLGDRSVIDLKPAKIAVVCEPPTSVTAYGAIWFLFEQQYGIPFTAIKASDLDDVELSKYNVIVLPDGQPSGYRRAFSHELVDRLKGWVREGGTLVAIKGAAVWASGDRVALTTARDRYASLQPEESDQDEEAAQQEKGARTEEEPPKRIDTVPGVFVQVDVDVDHYIGLGIDGPVAALFRSNVIFDPTRRGARVASLNEQRPIVAGFTFEEAREPLEGAPFVWDEPTGRGHVTLFADDPTFRTFLHGAHRLLLNAVLLGPSM